MALNDPRNYVPIVEIIIQLRRGGTTGSHQVAILHWCRSQISKYHRNPSIRAYVPITRPPSTESTVPVMKPAASEASQ